MKKITKHWEIELKSFICHRCKAKYDSDEYTREYWIIKDSCPECWSEDISEDFSVNYWW